MQRHVTRIKGLISQTHRSFEFFCKSVQVQIFQPLGTFKDFFQSSGWICIFCCVIIFKGIDCHFSCPLVRFWVNSRTVEHFNIRLCPIIKIHTFECISKKIQNKQLFQILPVKKTKQDRLYLAHGVYRMAQIIQATVNNYSKFIALNWLEWMNAYFNSYIIIHHNSADRTVLNDSKHTVEDVS